MDDPEPGSIDTSKINNDTLRKVAVNVLGTGNPFREFMYSLDIEDVCIYVMENVDVNDIIDLTQSGKQKDYHFPRFVNIGTREEIQIKELSFKIKKLIGFKGEIVFDLFKPDGPMREAIDVSLLKKLGYAHKLDLTTGLAVTYEKDKSVWH